MRTIPFFVGVLCCAVSAWAAVDQQGSGIAVTDGDVAVETTLLDSSIVSLDITAQPGEAFSVSVPLNGIDYTLDLAPANVRSKDFQLKVQGEDGSLVHWKSSVPKTLRGTIPELEGSVVAGSLLDVGLMAKIVLPDEQIFWLEPLSEHQANAPADQYLVYRDEDVVCIGGACGTDDLFRSSEDDVIWGAARGGACGTGLCVAELGVDADTDYFNDYGSVTAVEDRIELVINTVNLQYESEVDTTHVISVMIIRTAEPDPYSSSNYITLLNQFRDDWLANQNSADYDLAHLFTAKDLTGGVIGVAFDIGAVCTTNAFCLSQSDFSPNFACATDLSAHELGHLWNAEHCSCPNNTMNSFITCTNDFHDTFTVPDIISHRDSRACLDGDIEPPDAPANDDCANGSVINDGTTAFDTAGATTDGPALPSSCDEGFGLSFESDVWYNYSATCTGTMVASTCNNATFDTRLAMYDDNGCPVNSLVACNDDSDGCANFTSLMIADVTAGADFKIRLGSFDGTTGTGDLLIDCVDSGGSIPCSDISTFQAQCTANGRLRGRIILTDSSHDGEFVTFDVDGVPMDVQISGTTARFQIPDQGGTGDHVIELTDPAGCFSPITVTCD